MTITENLDVLIVLAGDDLVCVDRSHVAVDRVCVSCEALHLPSMELVEYCACAVPDLEIKVGVVLGGGPLLSWMCQTCEKPNLDAIRHPLV